METETMKISLTNTYGTYSIESKNGFDMSIDDVIDHLIKPLLLSAGYPSKLVDEYFMDGGTTYE